MDERNILRNSISAIRAMLPEKGFQTINNKAYNFIISAVQCSCYEVQIVQTKVHHLLPLFQMAARLNKLAEHLHSASYNVSSASHETMEQPLGTLRHVRIICIGAGASGISLIHTLQQHLTNYEITVYEKNPQVGGTWFENRYPGCKCDIPSHNYQFSFKPNTQWSSFFSPASEIQDYLCCVCDDENMRQVIKCEHKVVGAHWEEKTGVWRIKVLNSQTRETIDDYCHFLLDASGILK